jgi:hypothetical protein
MFFAALVVVIAHGRHITPAPGERSRGSMCTYNTHPNLVTGSGGEVSPSLSPVFRKNALVVSAVRRCRATLGGRAIWAAFYPPKGQPADVGKTPLLGAASGNNSPRGHLEVCAPVVRGTLPCHWVASALPPPRVGLLPVRSGEAPILRRVPSEQE